MVVPASLTLRIGGVMVSALDFCPGEPIDSPSGRNVYELEMYFTDEALGKSPRVRACCPRGATPTMC